MEFWAQRTVSPLDGRDGWTVVDDEYVEHVRVGEYLRGVVDRGGSVGTARAYAGRLALWLCWTSDAGANEVAPSGEQLAAFGRWLERTPSRKHRRGRSRRRSAETNVVALGSARSPGTVDGILAAVVELVRFAASRGWCPPEDAKRLSSRVELAFTPPGWDRGERIGRPVVDRRLVRRRRAERPPATLSPQQVGAVVDACGNVRDRFVVEALYATGLRVAELCGLRLADLHLLPSAAHFGCQVGGAHLRVIRREDNENKGAGWLAGEWDSEQKLILPQPGGALTRVLRCSVAGCPADRYGAEPLCHTHRGQFAASTITEVTDWLGSGEPAPFERRWCSTRRCQVPGADGQGCPRPAEGYWRLCNAHADAWRRRSTRGVSFAEFRASARPLSDLGPCRAACCYLGAAHRESGLCSAHFQMWRADRRPEGAAFTRWKRRVRQPVNSRVLSLRGLPELVVTELVYAIGVRAAEQVSVVTGGMRPWVDQLRALGVASVTEFDLHALDGVADAGHVRFARFAVDRVRLAYADQQGERRRDRWDLRLFGYRGRLDFTAIRQEWLREATKTWAATTLGRVSDQTVRHRLGSITVLSAVLAAGPGGGADPAALTRSDIDRFLGRLRDPGLQVGGRTFGPNARLAAVSECALMLRETRSLGLLPALGPTFAFRRGDVRRGSAGEVPGRALPAQVVAQLDAHLDALAGTPGGTGRAGHASLGALGERAGVMAVLAYRLLKSTGRRVGEIASLHLDCLDVDEYGKDVLVYDNHKAARHNRRLPIADTDVVAAIRAQQHWVTGRFRATGRGQLWLLPRPHKNVDGRHHVSPNLLWSWIRCWVDHLDCLDAGPLDAIGQPVPFDRSRIYPHAFRHTYAQTLADQGVPPSVLRDLMDHRSLSTTLGYYRVGDQRKRAAMDALARHTIDNRGVTRPVTGEPSAVARLNEQLSWVAVPMGKCSEPTNVRAGGQDCPIRYQCAGCPHFESDPSYLPELRGYADDLRRQREAMLAAGAADWATENISRQLEVIVSHVRTHEQLLGALPAEQRAAIDEACTTARKARRSIPVAHGRRRPADHHD